MGMVARARARGAPMQAPRGAPHLHHPLQPVVQVHGRRHDLLAGHQHARQRRVHLVRCVGLALGVQDTHEQGHEGQERAQAAVALPAAGGGHAAGPHGSGGVHKNGEKKASRRPGLHRACQLHAALTPHRSICRLYWAYRSCTTAWAVLGRSGGGRPSTWWQQHVMSACRDAAASGGPCEPVEAHLCERPLCRACRDAGHAGAPTRRGPAKAPPPI